MKWMDRALELAERGRYTVSPNPMVGAVVVRGGRVVGTGFHRMAGGPHAEVAALAQAGERAAGADLYVTLEPCAHLGRTPPCTDAILAAGIRRLVVAAGDPNPLVAGRGFSALRRAGVRIHPATPVAAAARRGPEREIPRLDQAAAPLRPRKVGRQPGRKDRDGAGEEPLDHRPGSPAAGPAASRGARRRSGWSRHRSGRQPAPDAASAKETGSRRTGGSFWTAVSGFRRARVSSAIPKA